MKFRLGDEARFIKSWFGNPIIAGAVSPSGRSLARMMASCIDPATPGPVIELGPGTGPVTEALIERGFAEERLVLVEFNPGFCRMLARRFPKATIVEGDAYAIVQTLAHLGLAPAAAVVSSLPLLTKPEAERHSLLREAFGLLQKDAPFVQFTYGLKSPVSLREGAHDLAMRVEVTPHVWLNLPPARVWCYRAGKADSASNADKSDPLAIANASSMSELRKDVRQALCFGKLRLLRHTKPALALIRKIHRSRRRMW